MDKWHASIIPKEPSTTPVRAAIAGLFYEKIVRPGCEKLTGGIAPEKLFAEIVFSLGVEFFLDEDGEMKFRDRSAAAA